MQDLTEKIHGLSPELRQEVFDFVDLLTIKRAVRKPGKLRLSWAGALQDWREQYSALEQQKQALERNQ